jgi:hypothetical protein
MNTSDTPLQSSQPMPVSRFFSKNHHELLLIVTDCDWHVPLVMDLVSKLTPEIKSKNHE